ncbi:hypothetical protein KZZ52_46590 [Dactylosporangium sp. AC04546]|uniref:hypothetical protein n=1 Tax=Dactylosporangium sp. AC04546 TaxID=2862460 RepID=UPI001EE13C24|nr:hypothetical protein [Dactylosporangium sp. AC04546]WVK81383.1 hypothetical protein KZZ52_46590 [Dactylosporangium sp. AC04546]
MSHPTEQDQDRLVRLLAPPRAVPPAAADPHGPAATALLEGIRRANRTRHRFLIAVPAAAAAAVVAFVVIALLPGGGPAPAHALDITRDSQFITIRIVDPDADPARYRQELARHGLNIELSLVPVDAGQVGRIVFSEVGDTGNGPKLEYVESPGHCSPNGSCAVAVRVPVTFTSYARLSFGRAAKAGEWIEGGSAQENADAAQLRGRTVADARRILGTRGQTATYRVGWQSLDTPEDQVPATWIVYDTAPLPDGVVALWVSADGRAPSRPSTTAPATSQSAPAASQSAPASQKAPAASQKVP